ncbi:STAS domain-containing protein [Streptomyces flavidovirens]
MADLTGTTPGTAGLHTEAVLTSRGAAVYLAGELDLESAEQMTHAVRTCLAQRPNHVRVDISELAFCDWYGLHTLLHLHREAQRAGITLVLSGAVRPQLARLLAVTGTAHLLTGSGARGISAARPNDPAHSRHCPTSAASADAPHRDPDTPSAGSATVPAGALA